MECITKCAIGVRDGVHDRVHGPKIVGIWSAWMNLLTTTGCRGPFANKGVVHG
jgi:hypothetical protein